MIGSADYPISLMQGSKFKNTDSELLESIKSICKDNSIDYEVLYEDSSDHASFNNLNIDALSFCHSDKTRIHTPEDTIDYIDTSSIDTVYKIVETEIKLLCYSGLTRFIYSQNSITLISIVLILLIIWGIFSKNKFLLHKNSSILFRAIALIAVISATIFYIKGYTSALIIALIFGFSIIFITLMRLNSKSR